MKRVIHKKPYTEMTADELAVATAEFDREFIADTFGSPPAEAKARRARAMRKRGRPVRGQGAKAISITVERGVLSRVDRLARKLGVTRAQLVERGLRAVLKAEGSRVA